MKPIIMQVFGDKTRKLEPEHHRIEFPGGSISIDRTQDGEYWAHFNLNHADDPDHEETHIGTKQGEIVSSRIDYQYSEYADRVDSDRETIPSIECDTQAKHIAIRFAVK